MINNDNILNKYGISEFIGRVCSEYKEMYKVITKQGQVLAKVSGRFRFEATSLSDYPAVGDFVMLDRNGGDKGTGLVTLIALQLFLY